MSTELILSPQPKIFEPGEGAFSLPDEGFILLIADNPADILFSAERLKTTAGRDWQITADTGGNPQENAVTMILDTESQLPDEGYTLEVSAKGIEICASTPTGIFYGVCTVCQLLAQYPEAVPAMSIRDWPDFPVRGVMIDISRDKVMTLETVMELVDMLAGWKVNHFQLYMEHTFAYRNHEVVWKNVSPMTGEEILLLDKYCSERFVDLVPSQNSFSHMSRWFEHEEYIHLANTVGVFETQWGPVEGSFTLYPGDSASIDFLAGLYDELLPHFTSRYFNVCCDEALDLDCGRSKELSEKIGDGRIYLDFLLKIHEQVKKHGRTTLFWADIMLRHPELIPELPKDMIALEWGYEPENDFAGKSKPLRDAGIEFWECPGTSSWMSMSGRTAECMTNLKNAAVQGLATSATGYLNTDWGDNGHWQYLPVSYLGFLYGAAVSWNSSDDGRQLPDALSMHAFGDEANLMGRLVYDLGKVHDNIAKRMAMGTFIWKQISSPLSDLSVADDITTEEFAHASDAAESVLSSLQNTRMNRSDADLIKAEYVNSIRLIKLGCLLGKMRIALGGGADVSAEKAEALSLLNGIITEHNRLWLARNKPGGLDDSRARLESKLKELS